jgi:CubicO group peptidase (beta-lactamase class C family)
MRRDFRWRLGASMFLTMAVAAPVGSALASCRDSSISGSFDSVPDVDAIFAEYSVDGSPGAAVMVICNGEVVHSAGYGAANLSDGSPLRSSTPVRLGSVSKAFTAMAVIILEERGDLEFDSDVTEWVPELARFDGITVRHLLNHTSGLPDYYDDSPLEAIATATDRDAPFQNAEAVSVYENWGEPLFSPGERFAYSNPGYEVLALIVERVSGMTFAEFLDVEIFAPLGMSTASVRYLPSTAVPGRAIGYSPRQQGEGWQENDDHWGNWLVGAGGVYASLDDLFLWDQALSSWTRAGKRTNEAFAPALLNDGTESPYGFGWNLWNRLDRRAIHHDGAWVGFRASLVRFPEEQLTVIVLSNASAAAAELADTTAAFFLDE